MSTPTRCHTCDRVNATSEDFKAGACKASPDGGCECAKCLALCWGACYLTRAPVDWRARCLQAEAALSLLSAPLSPEALQALVEESAE